VAGLWLCIAQFDVPKQQEIDPAMAFSLYNPGAPQATHTQNFDTEDCSFSPLGAAPPPSLTRMPSLKGQRKGRRSSQSSSLDRQGCSAPERSERAGDMPARECCSLTSVRCRGLGAWGARGP